MAIKNIRLDRDNRMKQIRDHTRKSTLISKFKKNLIKNNI